ncbi:MAG: hypothetical protein JRC93_12775 [Deltaproteobacteria bacterium]|nr:hypothetical protein [Deltaproteobacteria bacterium]
MDHEKQATDCPHKAEATALKHVLHQLGYRRCTVCGGSGQQHWYIYPTVCDECNGIGWVPTERVAEMQEQRLAEQYLLGVADGTDTTLALLKENRVAAPPATDATEPSETAVGGEVGDVDSYPFVSCKWEPLDTCEYIDSDGVACEAVATHRIWWKRPDVDGMLVCEHHFHLVQNTITEV